MSEQPHSHRAPMGLQAGGPMDDGPIRGTPVSLQASGSIRGTPVSLQASGSIRRETIEGPRR